jgi:hypothetical protein
LIVDVPRLETSRPILRGASTSDVEPCVRMMADAEVTRFLGASAATSRKGGLLFRTVASIARAMHFGARRTGSVEFYGEPPEVNGYPLSG